MAVAEESAHRRELSADCSRCAALCCVVPGFVAGVDFAIDKPAGAACPNLLADHRCGIHHRLRPSGFRGCVVFDCFGAGQRLVAEVPGAARWRTAPAVLATVRELLPRLRGVHELLWHLDEAAVLTATDGAADLAADVAELRARAAALPADAAEADVGAVMAHGGELLSRVSAAVRTAGDGSAGSKVPDLRGADLVGRDLRRSVVARADLRNALLIAADLRAADLTCVDLLGADLRDADLRGADLSTALFVTQPQVEAARGDTSTALPPRVRRPGHWP